MRKANDELKGKGETLFKFLKRKIENSATSIQSQIQVAYSLVLLSNISLHDFGFQIFEKAFKQGKGFKEAESVMQQFLLDQRHKEKQKYLLDRGVALAKELKKYGKGKSAIASKIKTFEAQAKLLTTSQGQKSDINTLLATVAELKKIWPQESTP